MINADVEGSEAFASRTFVVAELELAHFPVLAAGDSDGVVTKASGTAPLAVGAFFFFVISVLTLTSILVFGGGCHLGDVLPYYYYRGSRG